MMNRNWHENIRNKKSQVNSTDVQEDSMMIMLKPNVTNWIMLHQRDFNFQVHKVTFFQVMDHNLCSDSSKNLYRSLSLHEICENNNHKRRSTRWRCPRETFTWNFLTTRNHIYNGKTSLWLVTKKTRCGNKKAQSLQNHDNTIIVRYDTRSSIVQALIATLIRGEFYFYRKTLKKKVKASVSTVSFKSAPIHSIIWHSRNRTVLKSKAIIW